LTSVDFPVPDMPVSRTRIAEGYAPVLPLSP
jgi:hypothetical protein